MKVINKKIGIDIRNRDGIDHILLLLPIGEDKHKVWSSLSTGVDGCEMTYFSQVDLFMTEGGRILGICGIACANCKFSPMKEEGCQIYFKPEG